MNSNSPLSSFYSKSSSSDSPPSPQKKMMSLNDLYEVTNPIDNNLTLYYHLAIYEPIVFKEAIKDEKWRIAIDNEIASIKKNDT